jgi:hypothetical protein
MLKAKHRKMKHLQTLVATSHPCRALLSPQTNSTGADKAEFFFEGIQLPATIDNPEGSHGFVSYRIKPKVPLLLGDVIRNTAEIYFDFNSPITTNEVTTTVTELGKSQLENVVASVYPNPTTNEFTVETRSDIIRNISVYNLLGQLVQSVDGDGTRVSVNANHLQAGTYVVSIKTDSGRLSKKLVKN